MGQGLSIKVLSPENREGRKSTYPRSKEGERLVSSASLSHLGPHWVG
jgi:hypothetical protein